MVAFGLTWLLPEVPLRGTAQAPDPGQRYGMPTARTSLEEVERAIGVLARRENRREVYRRLAARAGLDLSPDACWLLYRFDQYEEHPEQLAGVVARAPLRVGPDVDELTIRGLVARGPGDGALVEDARLTEQGRSVVERLTDARRSGLAELLAGHSAEHHPELEARIRTLASELLADDATLLREASPVPV